MLGLLQYRAWAMADDAFMRYYSYLSKWGSFDRIIHKKKMSDFYPMIEAHLAAVDLETEQIGVRFDPWTGKEVIPTVKSGSKQIAILPVSGPLTKNGEACGYGMVDYQRWLAIANATPEIHGTVFIIDSPGGTVDGTPDFASAIANSPKPVGVFADHQLASAAMWIASQADVIVANKNNAMEIGNIGVLRVVQNYSRMMEKGNMPDTDIITAPQSTEKVQFDPTKPWNEGDLESIKEQLRPAAAMIIEAVKAGRGDKLDLKTEGLFKGRVYNGLDAKKAGLIDSVGTLRTAIAKVAELSRSNSKAAAANNNSTGINENANMKFPKLSALFSGEAWSKAISAFAEDQAPLEAAEKKVADMETAAEQLKSENAKLLSEHASATSKQKQLEATVTSLNEKVTTLEGEKTTLTSEVKSLQEKLSAAPTGKATTVIPSEKKEGSVPTDGAEQPASNKYQTSIDQEAAAMREAHKKQLTIQ